MHCTKRAISASDTIGSVSIDMTITDKKNETCNRRQFLRIGFKYSGKERSLFDFMRDISQNLITLDFHVNYVSKSINNFIQIHQFLVIIRNRNALTKSVYYNNVHNDFN